MFELLAYNGAFAILPFTAVGLEIYFESNYRAEYEQTQEIREIAEENELSYAVIKKAIHVSIMSSLEPLRDAAFPTTTNVTLAHCHCYYHHNYCHCSLRYCFLHYLIQDFLCFLLTAMVKRISDTKAIQNKHSICLPFSS